MHEPRRKLEIALLLMTVVSGLLVGISVGSLPLGVIAVGGAVLAFFVTDRWQIFSLDGWLANIASIVILYLVFRDFSGGDQTQKLIAVAQLLVYLQTVLMFQPKTWRLTWQIMILSLLQVVIAAIFTLEFEASFLFLLYFVIAGTGMMLQAVYGRLNRVEERNRTATRRQQDFRAGRAEWSDIAGTPANAQSLEPMIHFALPPQRSLLIRGRLFQYGMWLVVSATFATLAFCVLPRSSRPWYGPLVHKVTTAGMLKAVDLNQRDKIRLSKELVFRAVFEDPKTGKVRSDLESPYFRAMAFSQVKIENNRTSFTAPFDRVYDEVYQGIPPYRGSSQRVRQVITLEKTTDPLVYVVMPVFRIRDRSEELEFCHEISTYTRCREKEEISVAPYKYETETLLVHDGRFLDAWPYVSNTKQYQRRPMSEDPSQHAWLTQIERSRYPALVRTADRLAAETEGGNRLVLVNKLKNYFEQSREFQYSLDFSQTQWNEKLDPIEDFFSHQRRGHCELYAAALTMMLRSQNIPARLVVGFHGSEFNSTTKSYYVRGTHAHAWVEAYLRPEDCTPQMVYDGKAGPGGAWQRLDPTPLGGAPEITASRGNAIELARSVWQDYVLGMESEIEAGGPTVVSPTILRLMQAIDVDELDEKIQDFRKMASNPWTRALVVIGLLLLFLLRIVWRALWEKLATQWNRRSSSTDLRSIVADAIGIIAPRIGNWFRNAGAARRSTAFYDRMTNLLADNGLKRLDNQTHRRFAHHVDQQLDQHPQRSEIASIVKALTEKFNAIRFGQRVLDDAARRTVDQQLQQLESALAVPTQSASE